VAVGAVVALGVLAFACGGSAPPKVSPTATATARVTATADPRMADVEAAVRRYVQALADAMRTGESAELSRLAVQGSQAEGNAGVIAGIIRTNHKAFVTERVVVSALSAQVNLASAVVTVDYHFTGYDVEWPSMARLSESDRTIDAHSTIEMTLVSDAWLVDRAS
jgi:FAD/FMN-containing dehydrogenase